MLIPDPRALQPEVLLARVRDAVGPAGVVGAGAGDPISDAPLVWCGNEVAEGGARRGLVLRGAARAADRRHPGLPARSPSCSP